MARKQNGNLWRKLRARVLREETHCRECRRPVDKTLKPPNIWAPEVDHIVPLARGGAEYDRENLCLTHMHCNRRKGAGRKMRVSAPKPPVRPKESEAW